MTAEKEYLRSVRAAFPVYCRSERRFFADFRDIVHEYCLQDSQASEDSLISRFGQPKKIVMDYFDGIDSGLYLALMKRNRYIRIFIASVLVVLALIVGSHALFWSEIRKASDRVMANELPVYIEMQDGEGR